MLPTSWMMKLLLTTLFLFSFSAVAIPIGPVAPSLTGTKYSTSVQLDWNTVVSCNAVTYEIQESINDTSWSAVYSGSGNSGGTNASKTVTSECNGPGQEARYISLSNRTNVVYYYRIRACELGNCGQYGNTLQLGQPATIPTPTNITVPSGTVNGNFLIAWSSVTAATRYELQQQFNNGSWTVEHIGRDRKSVV